MTISGSISKVIFNRFVTTTCIVAQLTAGAVLLAGMGCAQAKGSGGGGGNSGHSNSGGNSSFQSSHSGSQSRVLNTIHPIMSKPSGSKESKHESRRERRKEIAHLRRLERCIASGHCGGRIAQPIGKPLPPQPRPIGGLPVESKPIAGAPGTPVSTPVSTPGGSAPSQPNKPPVLSDPGYGAPSAPTGGGGSGGGGRDPITNGGTGLKQD